MVLNFFITLAEFIGGLLSNSLALLSDALHNLSDTIAIFLSYLAFVFGNKKATEKKTFGYKRLEILAALFNAMVLIFISLYLFYEAYERLLNPEPIKEKLMFIVASIGLVANLVSVLLLHKDSSHNLNIKSAYLHLIGDTLSSVGVIAGSILIIFFKIYWIDPVITILIGLMILRGSINIIRETVNILMEASPAGLDINEIKTELEKVENIGNVHHIHTWRIADNDIHFQCHADLELSMPIEKVDELRLKMEKLLLEKFGINHSTIQMELDTCDSKKTIY